MTTIHEITTTSGTVWVRVDAGLSRAFDWTDGTSQSDIDAAVLTAKRLSIRSGWDN